ncbi:hypothetical protein [Nonomuraea sp. LPB2021202275-12-8]|uniref:hypothetical protein n=1 Tax=Nonomuraea sp. LPB2021202275-12-8 TaxID=3120159 RepID=UPI00300D0FD0
MTGALGGVFARLGGSPVWDRGVVLVQLAMAITLGATSMRQISLLAHHEQLFGTPASAPPSAGRWSRSVHRSRCGPDSPELVPGCGGMCGS